MVWKKKRWIRENMYGNDAKKTDAVCAQIKKDDMVMPDKYLPNDEDEQTKK